MAGTAKRINRQGWDFETSDASGTLDESPIRKLLDNGKFWILCFVIIIVITFGYVNYFNSRNSAESVKKNIVSTEIANFNDSAHQEFINSLINAKSLQGIVVDIKFVSPSVVSITVPANISNDDIAYAADYIGTRVLKEFNSRVVFEINARNYVSEKVRLIANANWNERRQGYVLKLIEQNNM